MRYLALLLIALPCCAPVFADPYVSDVQRPFPITREKPVCPTPVEGLTNSTRVGTAKDKLREADWLYNGTYYGCLIIDLIKTGNPEPVDPNTPVDPPDPNEPVDPPDPNTPDPNEPIDPPVSSEGIVYSQVKRTIGPLEATFGGTRYTVKNPALWDSLPEVARQFTNFNAPGQLVYRKPDGTENIIYDCFTKAKPCVPLDSSVSLDGTRVAFSVYRSDNVVRPWPANRNYPLDHLGGIKNEAQIYIYEFATGITTAWPHMVGERETSPVWLPNGKMMFSSTRNGQYRPWLRGITPLGRPEPRLFIANEDGSGAVDISPHEVGGALHPYALSTGRVAYASLWYSHNLAYIGTNGSINWPTTLDNMWMMSDMDQEGGDMTALLGGHRNQFHAQDGRTKNFKALHFIGERANNDICIGNYYRFNNKGLGDVVCFPPELKGIEGPAPSFLPTGIYSVANWSKSNDEQSWFVDGKYQGKIGFPEGTDDGQLILTVGTGYCTTVALDWDAQPNLDGKIDCDVGLYKTTVIPSLAMSDMELIVDRPDWHEFNARVVRSRTVASAPMQRNDTAICTLASSDAGSTDAYPKRAYKFNKNYFNTANNGGIIDGLDHGELAAIRFYEVLENLTKTSGNFKNSIGNRVKLLGDAPLLADKSFKVQLPCDTPYLMAGVDSLGRIIKRDQIPQSLRPGEERTCKGCHLHGEEGRPYEDSLAFAASALPLLTATEVPGFEADIRPILEAKCGSCHTDDVPINNYSWLTWDFWQNHVPADRKIAFGTGNKRFGLQRPYTSKYVNSMFARESLLYWKAADQRTDGRTDSTYSDDIDFGADHPTDMTAEELKLLAAWLDSGAAR